MKILKKNGGGGKTLEFKDFERYEVRNNSDWGQRGGCTDETSGGGQGGKEKKSAGIQLGKDRELLVSYVNMPKETEKTR